LRAKYGITSFQVKRFASSHFDRLCGKRKGAGRPQRYIETNKIMMEWARGFLYSSERFPTLTEAIKEGTI